MKSLEIFKVNEIGIYYFKLGEVSFLLDNFYKEKILPQAEMLDDEDAYIVLFRETVAKKLTDYAYFLKADFFFDTVIIKKKKHDTWFEVVGYRGETYDIGFDYIFSNTEEGLQIRVFRNDKENKEIAIRKTTSNGSSRLLKF
jgi:hypothetical protein